MSVTRALLDPGFEVRKERRSTMRGRAERQVLDFKRGGVELRAKQSGTGGTSYEFEGYAAVYDTGFEMYDWWGDQYIEVVNQGACTRTLAGAPDVPFLIGHDDGGIALARTKSGTLQLAQDDHGLHTRVPELDGSSPLVQSLVSAIQRGDMDEMSLAFVCRQQQWSPDYEQRNIIEMDIHRGDVSIVCLAANPATAGATTIALSSPRRPERRADGQIMDTSTAPDYNPADHAAAGEMHCPNPECTVDGGALNSADARYCDQCGAQMYDGDGMIVLDDSGVVEEVEGSMADANLLGSVMPLETLRAQLDLLRLTS